MMKIKKVLITTAAAGLILAVFSSFRKSPPRGLQVVENFELEKYLGTWYEIARLDFKWEKNLEQVTATYSLRGDGKVKVENKGYNYVKRQWEQSTGKAKFAGERNEGKLLVSFFGPFYSEYNIVALDAEYRHALVIGESPEYMWILSRDKTIPGQVKEQYLNLAKKYGVDTDKLVWTRQ